MSKIAFLFPGQGSQQVGMGRRFAENYPEAAAAFRDADEELGFSLSGLCFEGPEEELALTANTQPAVLTASVAAFRALTARGWRADVVAGHSLGEYSALVAAGSLTLSKSSSNTNLVPASNIVFRGSGASRTVTVTPALDKSGSSTITVTVSDGDLTDSDSFVLTVSAVNDPPTISHVDDQTVNEDEATAPIPFTIGDVETAAASVFAGNRAVAA